MFTGTLPPGDETSIYQGQIQARGVLPIAFSVISGSLPTGTSLNSSTGLIIGNPIGGNYTFVIKAENVYGSVTQEFSVSIVGISPLFTYDTLLYGVVDNPDCTTDLITAIPYSDIGPTGSNVGSYLGTPPITWSWEQDSPIDPVANFVSGIPDGISVDPSTGKLSGFPNNDAQIPNTGFGNYGLFSVKIRGTNAWGTYVYPPSGYVLQIQMYIYPSGTPVGPL
ncbi:MAG: hypothetical protein E6Q97_34600 [Desulfurellales bacterium]|nr:MAG: hypothetical protein E6Q97_34600 [Desulfurellales bacterium]